MRNLLIAVKISCYWGVLSPAMQYNKSIPCWFSTFDTSIMRKIYKQNLVFQLRALRLPVAGRTVANCGLSGPQLRDEVLLNV